MRLGDDVTGERDLVGQIDLPAGVDQTHDHPSDIIRESAQIGLGADRRERLPVDLGGVADVVEHTKHPKAVGRLRFAVE